MPRVEDCCNNCLWEATKSRGSLVSSRRCAIQTYLSTIRLKATPHERIRKAHLSRVELGSLVHAMFAADRRSHTLRDNHFVQYPVVFVISEASHKLLVVWFRRPLQLVEVELGGQPGRWEGAKVYQNALSSISGEATNMETRRSDTCVLNRQVKRNVGSAQCIKNVSGGNHVTSLKRLPRRFLHRFECRRPRRARRIHPLHFPPGPSWGPLHTSTRCRIAWPCTLRPWRRSTCGTSVGCTSAPGIAIRQISLRDLCGIQKRLVTAL